MRVLLEKRSYCSQPWTDDIIMCRYTSGILYLVPTTSIEYTNHNGTHKRRRLTVYRIFFFLPTFYFLLSPQWVYPWLNVFNNFRGIPREKDSGRPVIVLIPAAVIVHGPKGQRKYHTILYVFSFEYPSTIIYYNMPVLPDSSVYITETLYPIRRSLSVCIHATNVVAPA